MAAKSLDPSGLIVHRFKFGEMMEACDVFSRAAETRALKVRIEA